MPDSKKLKFFKDRDHLESWLHTEVIGTLLDNLHNMEGPMRKHYTDADRRSMKDRIHDVKLFFGA